MKSVKRIELCWTDAQDQIHGVEAVVAGPGYPDRDNVAYALDRLRALFDEWRDGD